MRIKLNKFLYLGLLSAFIRPLGLFSYFVAVVALQRKYSLSDLLFLNIAVCLLLLNFMTSDLILTLETFRFYFGFFAFYLFFKGGGVLPLKKMAYLLVFATIFEAILINTIVDPVLMPNFPSAEASSHFSAGYQRPYSVGGNASVSSSLLVVLYSLIAPTFWLVFLVIVAMGFYSSGSGMATYVTYLILRRGKKSKNLVLFFLLILLGVFWQHFLDIFEAYIPKIGLKYITLLIDFKTQQVTSLFSGFSFSDYFLGNMSALPSGYGGDFGWLYFIVCYGVVGGMAVIFFSISKCTKRNILPLALLILATGHYPVMFFLPGQIILGYVLADKYRKEMDARCVG